MFERNLPIKMVMQKQSDLVNNKGLGQAKFFCELTPTIQNELVEEFEYILDYYDAVFQEDKCVPAVGKITVKPDAIAKSYKPNDLCRKCNIIGSGKLEEIYIKVTKSTINETIQCIKNPPSKKFRANMTAVQSIMPVFSEEKISQNLVVAFDNGSDVDVRNNIKIALFDFDNDADNDIILDYVLSKLKELGLTDTHELVSYGGKVRYIKVCVQDFSDIQKIAQINGVKSIDFFREFVLPNTQSIPLTSRNLQELNYVDCDTVIGIIDGGISLDNQLISPYVIAREKHVPEAYINYEHATFIASMIQYGNILNGIPVDTYRRFKFVDIQALPNNDPSKGPTDSIGEQELMEIIIETMDKYSDQVKIWNLSLGIKNQICGDEISSLGEFLDYIQDEYGVQFFVASGNLDFQQLREWPAKPVSNYDRITSPADSVRAITVGSVALFDSDNSYVKMNEPSPFSRRGPGVCFIVKPDLVDYGGNVNRSLDYNNVAMKSLDSKGNIVEGIGTSYSTPRVVQKYAAILDQMVEKDELLAKAMLVHSARMNSRTILEQSKDNIKYFGFGIPSSNIEEILSCSENEITLVFKQKIIRSKHLEMSNFPYPKSLIRGGKFYGEIAMTLAYNPNLDSKFGAEYCRSNIDASFGTYTLGTSDETSFHGFVPLEKSWDERFEKTQVEHGFKWSPIKSYYKNLMNGRKVEDGWRVRVGFSQRNEAFASEQEFVLIVTIRDPNGSDIYTEVVNGLRDQYYVVNNLEVKQQIRGRN